MHVLNGLKMAEIGARMDLYDNPMRHWLNRFNIRGVKELKKVSEPDSC